MEENILLPFPSDYDEKLKVSSLDPNTEVMVVQSNPNLDINYFDARDMIAELPRILPESETPEGVGEVRISNKSRDKLFHSISNYEIGLQKAYIKAIPYVVPLIKSSLLLEEHRDRKKVEDNNRIATSPSDPAIEKVQRLYGCLSINSTLYRVKTTIQVLRLENMIGKYHGYDITEIELLSPKPRTITMSEDHVALLSSSISLAKLLKGVELSYEPNVKLLDAMQTCHQFALTGDYTELVKVYETARNKRLSTTLSDPLQSVKQAQAEMVALTKQATRIVVPSSPVQEQAEATLDAQRERNDNTLKNAQEEQVERKNQSHKL
ncbi:hypothetical protein [Porphyromonas uenonis]|uniref:hypothetical protein n=1 Tax=Porphyromonas uenonis TaxID=281920 RepID=UPI000471CB05|nr:hypothetical protein [Porphyromonas uenonis]